MKIKRFEASSMSDALQEIKKEFGEEAVILSAKTIKKGKNFLGKKSSGQVVVTAAIDKKPDLSPLHVDTSTDHESQPPSGNDNRDTDGAESIRSSIFKRFNPITKTGQKLLKPKIEQRITAFKKHKSPGAYYQQLMATGLCEEIAAEWDEQMRGLLSEQEVGAKELQHALSQAIQLKGVVGTLYKAKPGEQKCVVMMGPAGAGKTSAVAKMAATQALQNPNAVAIISLDNQRVAGAIELERFSKIIGVPFTTAFTVEELKYGLDQYQRYSLIIIDTPGIAPDDHIQREKLRRMLAVIENTENLLLLNATLHEQVMARMIEYFRPLKIQSLFFTGLDWDPACGPMINQSERQKLPIGYLSDSPKIPEGIQAFTADHLAAILLETEKDQNFEDDKTVTCIQKQTTAPYYVANRNSDIFHFHSCKAVKRINTDNMIVFKNPAQALGQHFKPCRMCCNELIVSKPLNRLARGYAGNRY